MIYINGESVAPVITQGFDVTTTPDYVTDGLIALYDGLKNSADGHINQRQGWADLSGNGRDLTSTRVRPFMLDSYYAYDNNQGFKYEGNVAMPTVKTVEVVFYQTRNTPQLLVQFNRSTNGAYLANNANSIIFASGVNTFPIDRTIRNSVSYDYDKDVCYVNGTEATKESGTATWTKNSEKDIQVQDYEGTGFDFYGELYSIRLYSRSLTDIERGHNLAIDIERYGIEVA